MAQGKKGSNGPIPVESLRHQDRRPNIPTEELRDFVKDEKTPRKLLYPRDPTLDPQLVWKGKDEQDREDLAVPVVPVFIQEQVHPQALIENLRRTARENEPEPELTLFETFNGLEFEKLIDFYQWDQNWSNRMILGDSLLVMASLAEKEGFKGKVQTIYMDPPYGIKFSKNWQLSTRRRDVADGSLEGVTRQPEQVKAFRDTWELGIHSYLAYLRDRLVVSRDLLTESGSVFVQISDENLHHVRELLDEVFGADNFCGLIAYRTTGGQSASLLSVSFDYLVWYAKNKPEAAKKFRQPRQEKQAGLAGSGQYTLVEPRDGSFPPRPMSAAELSDVDNVPKDCRILAHDTLFSQGSPSDEEDAVFRWEGVEYRCPPNSHWKPGVKSGGMQRLADANRLMLVGNTLRYKRYLEDYPVVEMDNVWDDTAISGFGRKKQYVVETSTKVVERCLLMTTDPGDLVLDPTCGSGTTAYVAEQWGRRWITIDTSRVALALARIRLMAARYPYYLLADSPEGQRKEAEISGHSAGIGSRSRRIQYRIQTPRERK